MKTNKCLLCGCQDEGAVDICRACYNELSYTFACVVDHATGGRLCKTGYEKNVYYDEIDKHVQNLVDEVVKEETRNLREKIEAAYDYMQMARKILKEINEEND